MKLTDRISPKGDIVAREVGGETVLMNLGSGTYFGLDGVGTRIWQLLAEAPRSLEEISAVVADEYGAPTDQVESDVLKLAGQLAEHGLVEQNAEA